MMEHRAVIKAWIHRGGIWPHWNSKSWNQTKTFFLLASVTRFSGQSYRKNDKTGNLDTFGDIRLATGVVTFGTGMNSGKLDRIRDWHIQNLPGLPLMQLAKILRSNLKVMPRFSIFARHEPRLIAGPIVIASCEWDDIAKQMLISI